MKRLIFPILLFLCASSAFAQTGWFPLHSFYSYKINGIYFINADTGFLSDLDRGGFKTTDGGLSWAPIPGVFSFNHIRFFNHNKLGFIGDFQTNDSGKNWTQNTNILTDVCFPSDSIGFTCGINDTTSVLFGKTFDGGRNWNFSKILSVPSSAIVEGVDGIYFRDEKHGFLNEHIYDRSQEFDGDVSYYTSDGGSTWTPSFLYYKLLLLHDSTWIGSAANDGALYMTKNDFVTDSFIFVRGWNIAKSDEKNIATFDFNARSINRTTDGGITWLNQRPGSGPFPGEWTEGDITTPTNLVGYVVGIDSQIYKTIDGGGLLSNKVDYVFNNSISLSPNPTSGILFVRSAPENLTSISIFNILGEKVIELLKPNAGEFEIDISKLPAGMYYARLLGVGSLFEEKILKE